jgi:hypothetical protein
MKQGSNGNYSPVGSLLKLIVMGLLCYFVVLLVLVAVRISVGVPVIYRYRFPGTDFPVNGKFFSTDLPVNGSRFTGKSVNFQGENGSFYF